ncbi:hypothetical protein ZWY2020_058464 [Hordeum vulgare]|nr:hypothetical protein ZWY2020_058464 [Hordeum vulgare]
MLLPRIYAGGVADGLDSLGLLRSFILMVDGFGASSVLRSIAAVLRLETTPELCFDRIIYIDCSEWKNRRAMQRAIAEGLELDSSVMATLDEQDEEDDLMNDEEVDVGIPLTRYGNNVMIWTFSRRCMDMNHDRSRVENKLKYTHAILGFYGSIKDLSWSSFRGLLHQEAATIVARNPYCCLYELCLHYNFHMATNFDWVSHASNYWVCDAVIQVTKQGILPLRPFLIINDDAVYEEGPYRWISVTSRNIFDKMTSRNRKVHGMQTITAATSSFFLAFKRSDHPPTLLNVLFEHSGKLGVLVLKCCAFDFALPPFLKCCSLRFLGLDNCTNDKTGEEEDHTEWAYLYNLSVEEKMDLMTNIRELNIEGVRGYSIQLTYNGGYLTFRGPIIKPTSYQGQVSLRLLVLDGCHGLKNIGGLPSSLEYFSFNGHGPVSQWRQTVELPPKQIHLSPTAGCTQLRNLLLCWLPNLVELDLSETAIKVLNFNSMVVQVPRLKRLYLIGCRLLLCNNLVRRESFEDKIRSRVGVHRHARGDHMCSAIHQHDQIIPRLLKELLCGKGTEWRSGSVDGYYSESLHVHDVSIRVIAFHDRPYGCPFLRWCCVERCPKLDTVFLSSDGFHMLETLWASDLLMARSICSFTPNHVYLHL